MALRRVKHFDQVRQFDTSGIGQNPNDPSQEYRALTGNEVDEGLSPSNVNPRGIGSIQRKKYRITQTAQLDTSGAPGTNKDEFDEARAYNP